MSKLNVFLDLDNTLICSIPLTQVKNNPKYNYLPFDHIDMIDSVTPEGSYRVYSRPGLQQFLTYLFKFYNISVFTHADGEYASFVIQHIILRDNPERKLNYFLHREHTEMGIQKYGGMKNLRILWDEYKLPLNPSNTVIIDDLDMVKQTNPYSCIKIVPFRIGEMNGEVMVEGGSDYPFLNVGTILYLLKQNYEQTGGFEKTHEVPILKQEKE